MRFTIVSLVAVSVLAVTHSTALAAVPVLNMGWVDDRVLAANPSPSGSSPYLLSLTDAAVLRITDKFIAGDTFYVYDSGSLILTTALNGAQTPVFPVGDPYGQQCWTNAVYQHGMVTLNAGSHSIVVAGNGAGGFPANFGVRIDSVPAPGSVALLGLASVAGLRRRRSKGAG